MDAAGVWCLAGYAALAWLARQTGEPDLAEFFLLIVWTGLPVFALFLFFRRREEPFPLGRLFFWAVAFRLCGLIGGPIFEDDFYRYLWDGYRFATAGTPYGVAPEAFFVDPEVPAAFQSILNRINNPDLPTIYAPTTQLVFLLGYWVQPGSLVSLQSILVLFDLATIALLLRLAPARNVMLFAWCPLVVKEIAFTAHPEGIGVCLLIAAIVLARSAHWRSAAVVLGLACAAKVFALLLAPLVLAHARARHWALFGVTIAALYAPFALTGGTDLESLQTFAREWEFNSAAFGVLTSVLPRSEAVVVLGLAFAALWMFYAARFVTNTASGVPRGDWIYGVFLFIAPVINPWYLLWLLPFATVVPSAWAWTASAVVLLSYITGINLNAQDLQAYQQPVWVRPVEFGLILLALAFDLATRRRSVRTV